MAVSSALANIALGLITSVVGGAAVWLWQHLAVRRSRRAKESFFGLARGTGCLIIFNNAAGRRGAMHHNDVQAMIEVATLAASTGSPVSVESCNDFQGVNGNRTEFCLGGPGGGSNPRTGAHLAAHLPGVRTQVAGTRPLTYEIGGRLYSCSPGSEEFALVAKFTPDGSTRPVILICGQTALSNRAAVSLSQARAPGARPDPARPAPVRAHAPGHRQRRVRPRGHGTGRAMSPGPPSAWPLSSALPSGAWPGRQLASGPVAQSSRPARSRPDQGRIPQTAASSGVAFADITGSIPTT